MKGANQNIFSIINEWEIWKLLPEPSKSNLKNAIEQLIIKGYEVATEKYKGLFEPLELWEHVIKAFDVAWKNKMRPVELIKYLNSLGLKEPQRHVLLQHLHFFLVEGEKEHIDLALCRIVIEKELKNFKDKSLRQQNNKKTIPSSFILKQNFSSKESQVKMTDCWNSLKDKTDSNGSVNEKRFIDAPTPLSNFKNIFSGKEVLSEKRVRWTGTCMELRFFVKEINNSKIEDLKKNIWQTATSCFCNKADFSFAIPQIRDAGTKIREDRKNLLVKTANNL